MTNFAQKCESLKDIMTSEDKDQKTLINNSFKEFFSDEISKYDLDTRININYWTDAPAVLIFSYVNTDSNTFGYDLTVELDSNGKIGKFSVNTVGTRLEDGFGLDELMYIPELLQESFDVCVAICEEFVDFVTIDLDI